MVAIKHSGILVLLALLSGCAGTSIFQPYPFQAERYKQDAFLTTHQANSGAASSIFSDDELDGPDALLHLLERARVLQLKGNYQQSTQLFAQAIKRFEDADLEATLRLSGLAEQGSSLLLNDNSRAYRGAPYERLFVHLYQAMNYLAQDNKDAAAVEFRKLALEQKILLEQYEAEVAQAESRLMSERIDLNALSSQLQDPNSQLLSELKSSLQNAYAFYLSAVFWEAQGDLNRARIDYQKVMELRPDLSFIQDDIARVSGSSGPLHWAGSESNKGKGRVVIFYEQGFVAAREEARLAFPVGEGRLFSMALPAYAPSHIGSTKSLMLRDENREPIATSEPILNVSALAYKHYQEQIPMLLLRQALRAVAKHRLQEVSQDKMGLAGLFAANVFSLLSERADLRSWLTLPQGVQVLQFSLSQGEHELELVTDERIDPLKIQVQSGQTLVIRVFEANNQIRVQPFRL